jgi:predicted nucleotidyltransferase
VGPDPGLIERLRAVLGAGPALRLAVLFGSSARGTRHAHSDVDIAILPADAALSLAHESHLQLALERACGSAVDLVRLDHAPLVLRWRIASEGVPVVGDHAEWARFAAATASEHADFAPALARAAALFRERLASKGVA